MLSPRRVSVIVLESKDEEKSSRKRSVGKEEPVEQPIEFSSKLEVGCITVGEGCVLPTSRQGSLSDGFPLLFDDDDSRRAKGI